MRKLTVATLLLALCAGLVGIAPVARAEPGVLTEVSDFGPNPGDLQMFEYVPKGLPPGAPLVVVMHGCLTQVEQYDTETGWLQLADKRKWALVFPQQKVTNNENLCLNWVTEEDQSRGSGEPRSIIAMVDWMKKHRGVDPNRVYATGHSAGGYFTSVMLLTYPEVFKAGAEVSGGPYRCKTYQQPYLAPPFVYLNGKAMENMARMECTQAEIDKSPQQWGDLARLGHSTYTGPKPRISLWHGSVDNVVLPKNWSELIEQWSNYLAIDMRPDVRETVSGYPHDLYRDAAGRTVMETYLLTGRGHSFPGDGSAGCPGQEDAGICAVSRIADWFASTP